MNEATIRIECTNSISRELTEYFSCFSENYRFHPKFKAKQWDGKLRFFTWENTLPIGLLSRVKEFCAKGKYTYEILYETPKAIAYNEFLTFVDSLNIDVRDEHNNSVPVRDYQLKAAYEAICEQHLNMASSTASGKSLIQYIIIRWLVAQGKKCLCIFPTQMLVDQIYSDFDDYGWESIENHCCMIYSGKTKFPSKKMYKIYFENGVGYKSLLGNEFIRTINRGMVSVKYLTEEDEIDYEWFTATYDGKQI